MYFRFTSRINSEQFRKFIPKENLTCSLDFVSFLFLDNQIKRIATIIARLEAGKFNIKNSILLKLTAGWKWYFNGG